MIRINLTKIIRFLYKKKGNGNKNDITKKNDKIILQDNGRIEIVYRKVMCATSETAEVSVDVFWAELMQCAKIADSFAHVEKAVEYVMEILIKHKEVFQTAKVFINQNLMESQSE